MSIGIIEKFIFWQFFYSVVGWVYESIICSVSAKRWVNRGFLNGPYCPIYGFGAVIDILILGDLQNPLHLFMSGMILTCTLEYLTSYAMEKMFHARWWDYSERNFNLNGRVCLLGAVVFGLFSVVLIKFIHPVVSIYTDMIPAVTLHYITVALLLILVIDTVITVKGVSKFDKRLEELHSTVEEIKAELTDKIHADIQRSHFASVYEGFLTHLNGQQKRMIKAFPKLKSELHNGPLSELKAAIEKQKHSK